LAHASPLERTRCDGRSVRTTSRSVCCGVSLADGKPSEREFAAWLRERMRPAPRGDLHEPARRYRTRARAQHRAALRTKLGTVSLRALLPRDHVPLLLSAATATSAGACRLRATRSTGATVSISTPSGAALSSRSLRAETRTRDSSVPTDLLYASTALSRRLPTSLQWPARPAMRA